LVEGAITNVDQDRHHSNGEGSDSLDQKRDLLEWRASPFCKHQLLAYITSGLSVTTTHNFLSSTLSTTHPSHIINPKEVNAPQTTAIMDSSAQSCSTTAAEWWPTLLRVITNDGGRPRYIDDQYVPCHLVYQIRAQMLESMFAAYGLVKLEPCLDPLSGRQSLNFYLATFPDFQGWHGAMGAWNAVELEQNPFVCMVVMEDVVKDKKLEEHLQCATEELIHLSDIAVTDNEPYEPADTFEDWWATNDTHHWTQHLERIAHEETLQRKGVWLYKSDPDKQHHYSDPTTYSYATPACIEYKFYNRYDDEDELMELIDWNATRRMERISFIPRVDTSLLLVLEETAITAVRTLSPESMVAFGSSSTYVARSDTPPEHPLPDLGVFEHLQEGWSPEDGRYLASGDVTYQYPHFHVAHPPTPPLVKDWNTSSRGSSSDSSGSVHHFSLSSMAVLGPADSILPIIAKPDGETMFRLEASKSLSGLREASDVTNAARNYEPLIVATFEQSNGSRLPIEEYHETDRFATSDHTVAEMPVMAPKSRGVYRQNSDLSIAAEAPVPDTTQHTHPVSARPSFNELNGSYNAVVSRNRIISLWLDNTTTGPDHYYDAEEEVTETRDHHLSSPPALHYTAGSEEQQYAASHKHVRETQDLFVRGPSNVSVTTAYGTLEVCFLLSLLPILDHFSLGLLPIVLRHPALLLLFISGALTARYMKTG
jgi:hypothetical protein